MLLSLHGHSREETFALVSVSAPNGLWIVVRIWSFILFLFSWFGVAYLE